MGGGSGRINDLFGGRMLKTAGVKLGRQPGPGKSKLDTFEPEIKALLSTGSTLKYIASRYGCAESTLINWLSKRNICRKNLVEQNLGNCSKQTGMVIKSRE